MVWAEHWSNRGGSLGGELWGGAAPPRSELSSIVPASLEGGNLLLDGTRRKEIVSENLICFLPFYFFFGAVGQLWGLSPFNMLPNVNPPFQHVSFRSWTPPPAIPFARLR